MVRAGYLIAFLMLAGPSGYAAEDDPPEPSLPAALIETRAAVKDTQSAERLIAAAEDVRDFTEMKQQGYRLVALLGRFPDKEDARYSFACKSAIDRLSEVARNLSMPYRAQAVVTAANARSEYLDFMPKCEALLKLAPPPRPNLR